MAAQVNKERPSPDARRLLDPMRAVNCWIGQVTVLSKYDRSKGLLAPEPAVIENDLRATASVPTDPPWVQRFAQILADWVGVAQRILGDSFDESHIDTLIALAKQGDAERPMGVASLLGTSTVRILIKMERYNEATATIVRLLKSDVADDPRSGRTLIETLSSSLQEPSILSNIKKATLLRALALASLIELVSERERLIKVLKRQLEG